MDKSVDELMAEGLSQLQRIRSHTLLINFDMKIWHIQTWGADTPHYLVSAETKKEAWLKVKMEWKKKYGGYDVGGYQSVTRGYIYQTENDLKEIVGLTTQTSLIVDLDEDIF